MESTINKLQLATIAVIAIMFWGWVKNIIALSFMDWSTLGVEVLLRIVGVPFLPIGAVMGGFV